MARRLSVICVVLAGATHHDARAANPDESAEFRRVETGLGGEFMPVGSFDLADPVGRSVRAYPALGGHAFVDYTLGPIVSVGAGGQITANVKCSRAFISSSGRGTASSASSDMNVGSRRWTALLIRQAIS